MMEVHQAWVSVETAEQPHQQQVLRLPPGAVSHAIDLHMHIIQQTALHDFPVKQEL
jgi:hypothetical protein